MLSENVRRIETTVSVSVVNVFQYYLSAQVSSGFLAANHLAALANQNVANNIPCEKPEGLSPYLPHKLEHGNRTKGWLIPKEPLEKKREKKGGEREREREREREKKKKSAFINDER